MEVFTFIDPMQQWMQDILDNAMEEAEQAANDLLEAAAKDENGCLTSATVHPKKLRFRDKQIRVYRFIWCVRNKEALPSSELVRHLCNNRSCFNPDHLTTGTTADNWADYLNHRANGLDFELLPTA
nr:HNH endonuclease [Amylibacter sp.]